MIDKDKELYKGLYQRELDRRADLDAKINVPITAITVLFSLIFLLVTKTKGATCEVLTLFYLFMSLSILFLLISLFFLVKSYTNFFPGHKYFSFPKASEIREYQLQLEEHHKDKEKAQEALENYLVEKYVKYATDGVRINDKRFDHLHYCRVCIILAMCTILVMAALSGITIIKTL